MTSDITQKTIESTTREWRIAGLTAARIHRLHEACEAAKKAVNRAKGKRATDIAFLPLAKARTELHEAVEEAIGNPLIAFAIDAADFKRTALVVVRENDSPRSGRKPGGRTFTLAGPEARSLFDLALRRQALQRQMKLLDAECDAVTAELWIKALEQCGLKDGEEGAFTLDPSRFHESGEVAVAELDPKAPSGLLGGLLGALARA